MRFFIEHTGNYLLNCALDYLRRELKVPQYSEMFDDAEVF